MDKLLIISLLCISAYSQHIELSVSNIKSQKGYIAVAVFHKEKGFPEALKDNIYYSESVPLNKLPKKLDKDFPPGQYAISIFHDLNNSKELETNWLGIPKEPFGFANNSTIVFGPPSFEDASIKVSKKSVTKVNIKLKEF